jgi:uncharacterized damage-inducible protein DinB
MEEIINIDETNNLDECTCGMVILMVEVRQLLEYNDKVRHRYFETLAKLPWDEFVKNREASFHSLRNIFIHALGATDYWLDFLQKEDLHSRKKFDEYGTFQDVRTYMEHVETRMRDYLNSLSTGGLEKKYTVTNDADETIEITAEDVLIHVFEEEVHHRGELIALLWQMGVEPPLMGWKEL